MEIEAIHERAIALIVAGKRQCVIARELEIGVRTLRRWASDEQFTAELKAQREFARQLAGEQLADDIRLERQIAEHGARRICELIDDPKTPDAVRNQCLRISQNIISQRARREQSQEWREFVYHDAITREKEKADAEKKERDAAALRSREEYERKRVEDYARYERECEMQKKQTELELLKYRAQEQTVRVEAYQEFEKRLKAAKSGQLGPGDEPIGPLPPQKSGQAGAAR
jgi:hypothetical protein